MTSLEDLVSEITAGNFHVVPPPKLRRVKHSKRPLVHGFIVWQCSTFGGAVVGSTITIATDGVFLLAGKGAHFRGTTFNGTSTGQQSTCGVGVRMLPIAPVAT